MIVLGWPQVDEYIMTFNSGMKCKLYSSETQLCRKISLGPTFSGVINHMSVISMASELKYFAFTSGNVRLPQPTTHTYIVDDWDWKAAD